MLIFSSKLSFEKLCRSASVTVIFGCTLCPSFFTPNPSPPRPLLLLLRLLQYIYSFGWVLQSSPKI